MKIPAYWSRASIEQTGPSGQPLSVASWQWSDASEEDAHRSALAAARRAVDRLLHGERPDAYGYTDRPLREEVLERFSGDDGDLTAALTRNRYGAIVLNAASAMFIDLDFPLVSAGEQFSSFFARLFNRRKPTPEVVREQQVWDRLEDFVQENHGWSFRVYRTAAGIRALATHDLFDPTSPDTIEVMNRLGADPLYVRMCKAQACFRARLTPKPWRCGQSSNTVSWPWQGDEDRARFEQWNTQYEQSQDPFATCRFIGTLGLEQIHSDLHTIVKLHDRMTRCDRPLPLA